MKAPKVSKKLWEGRQPLGHIINALPHYWLALRDNGDLWVMWDKSTGESTGAQVCLGVISAATLQTISARANTPYELVAKGLEAAL